jgi:hypothetical protein
MALPAVIDLTGSPKPATSLDQESSSDHNSESNQSLLPKDEENDDVVFLGENFVFDTENFVDDELEIIEPSKPEEQVTFLNSATI